MPIMGVSDEESVEPRTKEIGRLYKGAPKKNGGQFGDDLDHFRFVSPDPLVQKAFENAYGTEPAQLRVYFWHRTVQENFGSWRESYGQNGLCKVRCDGDYIVDWIEGDRHHHGRRLCDKPFKDTENRCPGCPLVQVGRLSVILLPLWEAGHFGTVMLTTHSWNDIAHLASKLTQWQPNTGREFILRRQWQKVGAPIGGKRAAVDKCLVKLELTDEWMQRQLTAYTNEAEQLVQVAALPEAVPEHPDDGAIEVVEGEPVESVEPEPKPHEIIIVEPLGDLECGNLAQLAKDRLPSYAAVGEVMTAMLNIYGAQWKTDNSWDATDAWYELQTYKRAPAPEST